jgi:hypothetical protein
MGIAMQKDHYDVPDEGDTDVKLHSLQAGLEKLQAEKEFLRDWRSVVGYEGRYEVSLSGEVLSLLTGRILKPGTQSRGYQTVLLYDGSSPKRPQSKTVHSLVAEAFLGPRPDKMTINHLDGDKSNNRLDNLEYCSMRDNARHAVGHGLMAPPGSHTAKLDEHQVQLIRDIYAAKPPRGTQACLARALDVTPNTIRDAANGKHYPENGDSHDA